MLHVTNEIICTLYKRSEFKVQSLTNVFFVIFMDVILILRKKIDMHIKNVQGI